ncbi:MAG: MMPL family transporter [Planctomycetia bacterium]|nr:MMPL family transporter [Planctomycetia bacterium]
MKKTFYEKYAIWILILVAFSLPIMATGVKRSLENIRNNIKEWLPDGTPETAMHRWFQDNFKMEQFILMSWENCSLNDPRMAVMKHRLLPRRDDSGNVLQDDYNLRYYEKIMSGSDLIDEMLDNYSSMTREQAIERLKGSLIGMDKEHTGVLIHLRPGSEGENLKGAVSEIYRLARQPFVFQKSKLTPDQLAAVDEIQKNLAKQPVGVEPKTFLERQNKFPIPVKPTETEKKKAEIPSDDLIELPGLQPSQLHLGGPPVDNIAIDVEGNRTLLRLAWMAAVVGLTIAILCLRSVRLVCIVFTAALFSTGYAMAFMCFSGSETDAIMLSMPPLVYVLTMSGAIHFINYYHDALEEEGGFRGAPERALRMAFVPMIVSSSTTSLGLFSLMTSNLGPIYRFGLYSGIGVILSLLILFLYIPACLQLFPSRKFVSKMLNADGTQKKRKEVIGQSWQKLGTFVVYRPKTVLTFCTLILLAGFAGIPHIQPSVKLMNFFKSDTSIIRDYSWLEKTLGPLVPMEVVIRFDNEINTESMLERLRLIEKISTAAKAHKEIGGVLSTVSMTPDLTPGSSIRDRTLNRRLASNYSKLTEYVNYDLKAAEKKYKLAAAEKGLDRTSPSLEELGLEGTIVEHLHLLGINSLENLREKIEEITQDKKLTDEQIAYLEDKVFRWQINHGDELWRVTCRVWALTDLDYGYFVNDLRKVIDPVVAQHVASDQPGCKGVEAIYTGSVPLVYKTQHELMRSLYQSILLAFVTISIVMMIMLRNFWGGFVSMIPNIFPIAVVFGFMGWFGILCDLGAMMTASVALGIATDDTIHYLTWYRRALDEGLHHHEAALSAYRRCATAMTQTTLISAFGLSVFAFSTFTPTLYFGVMMLILMFMALFGDMIYLPSILIVSGGRIFSKGKEVTQD